MKHYHLRWSAPADDHPDWIACEVSDDGHVLRTVEHFAMGWADYRDAAREEVLKMRGAVAHADLGGTSARKVEFLPHEGKSRHEKVDYEEVGNVQVVFGARCVIIHARTTHALTY